MCLLIAPVVQAQANDQQAPCEAYSQSSAVFVGTAAAPVKRLVQLPKHPPIEMTLTPMIVERAYLGVTTSLMYLTPLGIDARPTVGRKYLVYGREYRPPDIVMASPGIGAKNIESADEDLAFLDTVIPGTAGGTIAGIVQLKDRTNGGPTRLLGPVESLLVSIFNDNHSITVVSGADGRFVVTGLPDGQYDLVPRLPDDLTTWDSTSRITALIRDGGCATPRIDVVPNGRIRGVLRGPDGRPLTSTSVDVMPVDVQPEPTTGRIDGTGSVSTNQRGEFEFAGRSPGRYYLGVSLYNAPNPNGPSYPRTYYPGTTDRTAALPVVVERGRDSGWFDFSIPMILDKSNLEVLIETDHDGELSLCFVQLDDAFAARRSSWSMQAGVPRTMPVVQGQRYEVHAHLEFPGGHLESEPYVFTAADQTTVVTLRPDSRRILHR